MVKKIILWSILAMISAGCQQSPEKPKQTPEPQAKEKVQG